MKRNYITPSATSYAMSPIVMLDGSDLNVYGNKSTDTAGFTEPAKRRALWDDDDDFDDFDE